VTFQWLSCPNEIVIMKAPTDNQIPNTRIILNVALVVIFLTGFKVPAAEPERNGVAKPPSIEDKTGAAQPDDHTQCEENLLKVSTAIEAYRKDHKELPNWLSDLVPVYLAETNRLICPISARTGKKAGGMKDPKIWNAYHYEFNPSRIDANVQSFWGETEITMREWKQQQEKIVGAEIPVVRCFMHGENSLDLTLNGKVRDDPLIWEQKFTSDKIKLKDMAPRPATKPGRVQEF
jgi:hypothetical protein